MSILNLNVPCDNNVKDCVLFTRIGLKIRMECEFLWVISASVNYKKDDLMFGTRHSPMATRERLPCSTLSFTTSLRLPNLITPGETQKLLVSSALCQESIVFLQITYG